MFKKNVYAFSALLALSCSVYAMEERDDLSSSVERKGNRNALDLRVLHGTQLRQTTAVGEEDFETFPLVFDFSAVSEDFSPKITVSPASSTQSSSFNAEIAAQEEIEKQLTSRLAELESALEASKVEATELRTSLERERAQSQLLQGALDAVNAGVFSDQCQTSHPSEQSIDS